MPARTQSQRLIISRETREHIQAVLSLGELEGAIRWREEMMIRRHAGFARKQAAAANQLLSFAVDPDIEILVRLIPPPRDVHAFNHAPALRGGKQQCAEIDFRRWGILSRARHIRPEENDRRLSHLDAATAKERQQAVTDEMASDRAEMVTEKVSAIPPLNLYLALRFIHRVRQYPLSCVVNKPKGKCFRACPREH